MAITFEEISRMSLFRGFDENFVRLLDVFFVEKNYPQGAHIIQEGELQKTFFMIISGEVEVSEKIDDQNVVLNTLVAGQFFGEINLFDPGIAVANVVSLTPVKTLEISNDQFRNFIQQKPTLAADFTYQIAETVAKRFRVSHDAIQKQLQNPQAIRRASEISNKKASV